jgi:hypothetical protein
VNEVGIEVPLEAEAEEAADEVLAHAESVVMRAGAPFVPIKHEGTIYIRPPLSQAAQGPTAPRAGVSALRRRVVVQ